MVHGAVESYQPDELVVALPNSDVVSNALTDLRITVQKKDHDNRLGLALLTLGNIDRVAAGLRQDDALMQRVTAAKWPGGQPQGIEPSDLDVLLVKLRDGLAAGYGGWIPDIGKNRMIAPVRGLPYVGGCAVGNPWELGIADPVPQLTGGQPLGWAPRTAQPGQGVWVGLLDTKLYPDPWFDGGYLATEDDLLQAPGPGDPAHSALDGHATFIAGLILHRAPGAALVVHSVLRQNAVAKTWDVAKAMAQFAGTGVDILNLSFGCYTDDNQPPMLLARAVSLVSPQILLVAAAGNHGNIQQLAPADRPVWTTYLTDKTPVWPAAFAEVTAVGASDGQGVVAAFTPNVPWVDVTAPGVDVESTYLNEEVRLSFPSGNPPTQKFDGYARWEGTSFAAANVTGAVAAKIGPGRDAQQALQAVLADPNSDVRPFR
jgi:hypothetical protein